MTTLTLRDGTELCYKDRVYAGAAHATCNTHAGHVNADLLAFIKG